MIVAVKVHPNSKRFKIEQCESCLEVWLTEPAEKGKANIELIKELTKRFGNCRIVKGVNSKRKIVEIY
ncbi:MAG: DUF167 domain-containing protein [Candidatus Aenigmatarchaeota archaeon]|nr:DUF167 domain-containing protein [Candidatus Aenigmarchaeota archaeon]